MPGLKAGFMVGFNPGFKAVSMVAVIVLLLAQPLFLSLPLLVFACLGLLCFAYLLLVWFLFTGVQNACLRACSLRSVCYNSLQSMGEKAVVTTFVAISDITPLEFAAAAVCLDAYWIPYHVDLLRTCVALLVLMVASLKWHLRSKLYCRMLSVSLMWVLHPSAACLLLSALDLTFPPGWA